MTTNTPLTTTLTRMAVKVGRLCESWFFLVPASVLLVGAFLLARI